MDYSHGYDAIAAEYLATRAARCIGADRIAEWARSLPAAATILDAGCGNGIPVTRELIAAGHSVLALDASQAMIRAFRARFPHIPARCETLEHSDFFKQQFDGVVAIGLLFLFPAQAQLSTMQRLGGILKPGGSFLFTAPLQSASWSDAMTNQPCTSLGRPQYEQALTSAGLSLAATFVDEGGNHYYSAVKTP